MGGTEAANPTQTSDAVQIATYPKPTEWTDMPALDLLYGPRMPVPAQQHKHAIVEKILSALRKRHEVTPLILHGRTIHYHLIDFEFNTKRPFSFRSRLDRCFAKRSLAAEKQVKIQPTIHKALEETLWLVICWNMAAFPELVGKTEGVKELFPPLFPGSSVSILDVLKADEPSLQLDFSQTAATAKAVFDCVLRRVRTRAADSPLLRAEPLAAGAVPDVAKYVGEGKKAYNRRRKHVLANLPTPPECLLTLAFTTENFYTALVRRMSQVADEPESKNTDSRKAEHAVEALLYRLTLKEPRAFAEVYAHVINEKMDV